MKFLLIPCFLFLMIPIHAQNWIGNSNFIDMYEKSDVVIIGSVTNIQKYQRDTTKYSFRGPLKSMILTHTQYVKGNSDNSKIYYRDIFNGCGYAVYLVENEINDRTIIFGKIKNHSIFQIGSMNESPNKIAEVAKEFHRIKSNMTSQSLTQWFYEAAQNRDVLELLNDIISFEKEPLSEFVDQLNFSVQQRNTLYDAIEKYEEYDYDVEGTLSILVKYKDKRLQDIIKKFIRKHQEDFYSGVDDLMHYLAKMTQKKRLLELYAEFKADARTKQRRKAMSAYVLEM